MYITSHSSRVFSDIFIVHVTIAYIYCYMFSFFQSLQAVSMSIGPGHPLHRNLETIFQKVPPELRERMNRHQLPDDTPTDAPSDKSLIRLHKQVTASVRHNGHFLLS
jgi:hypothetical protein